MPKVKKPTLVERMKITEVFSDKPFIDNYYFQKYLNEAFEEVRNQEKVALNEKSPGVSGTQ